MSMCSCLRPTLRTWSEFEESATLAKPSSLGLQIAFRPSASMRTVSIVTLKPLLIPTPNTLPAPTASAVARKLVQLHILIEATYLKFEKE